MRSRMTERGRRVLAVLLVGSLLAMFAGALPVVADEVPPPIRILPATVMPDQEFEVEVVFVAPCDDYLPAFADQAPAGWTVSVHKAWCTPEPWHAATPQPNQAQYVWDDEEDHGTTYTVVYKVLVPAEAGPGEYSFSGTLGGYCGPTGLDPQPISGQQTVTIGDPNGNGDSSEVDLIAHTPVDKGFIQLIKEFDPDDTEFPHTEIDVEVTGDGFSETYTLRQVDGWQDTFDDIPVGTYTVEELTAVPGWIPSYAPGDRQLVVGSGDVATMTITNTYLVGSIELIKLFEPGDTEYPHDQIDVRITGPDDFDQTYTLTQAGGWEKTIPNIPVGMYTVEELTFVMEWIPSYNPVDRQLEVEDGETATMTITNTHSAIGISVSPAVINFGEIIPGETKDGDTITVTNTGSVAADVRAEVDVDTTYNDDGDHFYTDALRLAGEAASGMTGDDLGSWRAEDIGLDGLEPGSGNEVNTAVVCPAEMYPDTEYTGKLLFTASASD